MSGTQSVRWNSTMGFGLAALGSAVGLGNVWRFPYVMGENGGGAFLLAYLLSVLVLGWPLLVAEIGIGRHTHTNGIAAYEQVAPRRPWRWTGWVGVAACLMILSYYPVIAGWVGHYLGLALQADMGVVPGQTQSARFASIIEDGQMVVVASLLVLVTATTIVAAGVSAGIERSSKLLMPLFVLLLLGLAIHSLTLPGARQALSFMLRPEWSALLHPGTWLVAFGQALFSIGLAMGVMVVYGSYLPDEAPLSRLALAVILGDTMIAVLASIVIFPAVYTFGLAPAQGPGLVFVILPEVFSRMPGGGMAGVVFFLLLLIAGLTSVVSLLEVPVSLLMSRWGWSRHRAAWLSGAAAFAVGVPVALGEGTAWLQLDGMPTLLDMADRFASYVLLPLSALAIALVVGWRWQEKAACDAVGVQGTAGQRLWWRAIRWLVPVLLVIVLVSGLVTA